MASNAYKPHHLWRMETAWTNYLFCLSYNLLKERFLPVPINTIIIYSCPKFMICSVSIWHLPWKNVSLCFSRSQHNCKEWIKIFKETFYYVWFESWLVSKHLSKCLIFQKVNLIFSQFIINKYTDYKSSYSITISSFKIWENIEISILICFMPSTF